MLLNKVIRMGYILLLLFPLAAQAEQVVSIASLDDFFSVVSTAIGKITEADPFIYITLLGYVLDSTTHYGSVLA